jgi:type I restriction enzyme S subunit
MRDGWTETSLGTVLKLSNKKLGAHKEEPEIFAISKYDGVVLAQDYFDRRIASKSLDGYKVIGPGDWVYSTIHIDEGSIAVNHFPFRGVVSPMYTSMIWNSHLHDCRFFELLLKSDGALIRYQENAQGTVNRRRSLSWKAFSEMTFVVPPHTEQKRIVDMVSSVDAYIDALQQQADMARTARNAVLHELLSAGGDGWTETNLGDIAEVLDRMRKPISSSERENRLGDVPYYGATGQAGWIDKPIFDEELVLLGEDAIDFLNPDVHKAYLISGPSWVNNHAHVLRAKKEKVFSFFLMEALNAVDYSQFVAFGTRSKLTQGSMMGISVQVPPLAEQKRIVEIVSSMDDVIQSTEQAVIEAKRLRSGLLSDLLSGEHEIPASYDSLLGAA